MVGYLKAWLINDILLTVETFENDDSRQELMQLVIEIKDKQKKNKELGIRLLENKN